MVVEVAWAILGLGGLYCSVCCMTALLCSREEAGEPETPAAQPWLDGIVGLRGTPPSLAARDTDARPARQQNVRSKAQYEQAQLRRVDPPCHFLCPITMDVMSDPVTCVDGHHTFDGTALRRALAWRAECPVSRVPMREADMQPDAALDGEIVRWVASMKAAFPDLNIVIPPHKQTYLHPVHPVQPAAALHSATPAAAAAEPRARSPAPAKRSPPTGRLQAVPVRAA